jgi:hypothetical protein
VLQPNQILAGVGYSLGAIVLNHYVSKYEDDVALDVSVSISGALYSLYQKDYVRSKHTWQRIIAAHMKDMFMFGKWGERLYRRLGQQDYQQLLRAQNVIVSILLVVAYRIPATLARTSNYMSRFIGNRSLCW